MWLKVTGEELLLSYFLDPKVTFSLLCCYLNFSDFRALWDLLPLRTQGALSTKFLEGHVLPPECAKRRNT